MKDRQSHNMQERVDKKMKLLAGAVVLLIWAGIVVFFVLPIFNNDTVRVQIQEISPSKGAIGTTVTITGSGFGDYPGDGRVYFGEKEAVILTWHDDEVRVKVPTEAKTGDVRIKREGKKGDGKVFTVVAEEYEMLAEKKIAATSNEQVLNLEQMEITIPPNLITENLSLAVSKVTGAAGFSEDMFEETEVYHITLGEQSVFDDFIAITFPISEDEIANSSYIRMAYWDEELLEWIPAPTHIDEEKGLVTAYTNHLSKWRLKRLKLLYDVHETDHFMIAYSKKEQHEVEEGALSDIDAMAQEIGKALDIAYRRYFNELGEDYSPVYQYAKLEYVLGTMMPDSWFIDDKKIVDTRGVAYVRSRYNKDGAEYNWRTRSMRLPTKYKNIEELITTAGHELFHVFQHHKMTVAEMASARWLMEATAEYACFYVGTDIGIKKLHRHARVDKNLQHFDNREEGHEYGMASYIHFLVQQGANFGEMWRAIINNRPMLERGFDSYVLQLVGFPNTSVYGDFWRNILTNSDMPEYSTVHMGVRSRFFTGDDTAFIVPMTIRRDWSMHAIWTRPRPEHFKDGKVTLTIEPIGKIPEGMSVEVLQLDNFEPATRSAERVPGGKKPVGMLFEGSIEKEYIEVPFEEDKEQIIFITAYGMKADTSLDLKVSMRKFEIEPQQLEVTDREEEHELKAKIENIPKAIENLTFNWKLANGTILASNAYQNDGKKIEDTLTYAFEKEKPQNVELIIINTKTQEKIAGGVIAVEEEEEEPEIEVLIVGPRIIPIELSGAVSDSYEYTHTFEAVARPSEGKEYRFVWDFGDNQLHRQKGETSTYTYTYRFRGSAEEQVFKPTVRLYDADMNKEEVIAQDSISIHVFLEEEIDPRIAHFKQFDRGYYAYDYSQFRLDERPRSVSLQESNYRGGMRMTFYDDENTKIRSVQYYRTDVDYTKHSLDGKEYTQERFEKYPHVLQELLRRTVWATDFYDENGNLVSIDVNQIEDDKIFTVNKSVSVADTNVRIESKDTRYQEGNASGKEFRVRVSFEQPHNRLRIANRSTITISTFQNGQEVDVEQYEYWYEYCHKSEEVAKALQKYFMENFKTIDDASDEDKFNKILEIIAQTSDFS